MQADIIDPERFALAPAGMMGLRMFGILGLGLLLGMQRALEADHIAAVSSIAARQTRIGDIVAHGLTWGLGHTITLFGFAGAAILLGQAIPDNLTRPIETAVGAMLVGLGAHVLYRLWCDRLQRHRHEPGGGSVHIHARSHAIDIAPRLERARQHGHAIRWRSLLVGLIHGTAGSAALVVLTASQVPSPLYGIAYIFLFGAGSMLGMGALSVVIAAPLAASALWLVVAHRGPQGPLE